MDVIKLALSMTGYGRGVEHLDKTTITVEIRSVNHRYLDFSIKLPRSLLFIEDKIKQVIQANFMRGRIEVYVMIDGERFVHKDIQIDWELMDQYMNNLNKAKDRYNLSGEIPSTVITMIPELIGIQEVDKQSGDLIDSILISTAHACEQVLATRKREGAFLIKDIIERIHSVQAAVTLLQDSQGAVLEEYRERIEKRIALHFEGNKSLDQMRIYQEVALLAEKGDITEEIIRLQSHLDHFLTVIDNKEAIGRTLDFIIQEMHREINTVGAKSVDKKIGKTVVLLKGDLEKIREQIQNIE